MRRRLEPRWPVAGPLEAWPTLPCPVPTFSAGLLPGWPARMLLDAEGVAFSYVEQVLVPPCRSDRVIMATCRAHSGLSSNRQSRRRRRARHPAKFAGTSGPSEQAFAKLALLRSARLETSMTYGMRIAEIIGLHANRMLANFFANSGYKPEYRKMLYSLHNHSNFKK